MITIKRVYGLQTLEFECPIVVEECVAQFICLCVCGDMCLYVYQIVLFHQLVDKSESVRARGREGERENEREMNVQGRMRPKK